MPHTHEEMDDLAFNTRGEKDALLQSRHIVKKIKEKYPAIRFDIRPNYPGGDITTGLAASKDFERQYQIEVFHDEVQAEVTVVGEQSLWVTVGLFAHQIFEGTFGNDGTNNEYGWYDACDN